MLYDEFYEEGKKILDYWLEYGFKKDLPLFHFYVDENNIPTKGYNCSSFLITSRALFSFSLGYELYKDEKYLEGANRAYEGYKYFFDKEKDGYFNSPGRENFYKKKIYDHAFGIYGLAKYYQVTKNESAIKDSFHIFELIEKISYDKEFGGYYDTFDENWNFVSRPKKPESFVKDMNPMLHILEAYTLFYEVTRDERVYKALFKLTRLFLDKIYNKKTNHLNMYFDKEMSPVTEEITCGHGIEASWLLWETALVINDEALTAEIKDICIKLCEQAIKDGTDKLYGGICDFYKKGENNIKVWWEQAEAVVGSYNIYQLTGDKKYFDFCIGFWNVIKKYFIADNGEWHNSILNDSLFTERNYKIGPDKCPYHNFRMCGEMLKRLKGNVKKVQTA